MRLKKAIWIPLVLGALVGASGFVWLPVPLSLVRKELQARHAGFDVEGEAGFRWAAGLLRVRGVRLLFEGRELAAADSMQLRVDLRPWRSARALAARARVQGLRAELDAARVEQLLLLKDPDSAGLTFELELEAGAVGWTEADGRHFAAAGIQGRVVSQVGADRRLVAHAAASARVEEPLAAAVDLRLRVGPEPGSWELSADVDAPELPAPAALGLQASGLDWRHAGLRGRLHLQPDLWRMDLTGSAEGLRHRDLPMPVTLESLHLTGDARRAVLAEIGASSPHGAVAAQVFLRRESADPAAPAWAGWSYDGHAQIAGTALDAGFRTRLTSVLPEATEVLDNLGLSGIVRARLRVSGAARPQAPAPQILAVVPFAGLGFRYEGFTDEETGERFAFPEPVALESGFLVAADRLLLLRGTGRLSEAEAVPEDAAGPAPGIFAAGTVQIAPDTALVDLDIEARRYPVGPLLGRRLAANPELAGLWDELGSPRGGRAEAVVRLRSRGPETQVFVDAHVPHLRAEPPLLGEPVSVETVDFHFADGDLSIGGDFSAAGIRVRAQTRSRRIGAEDAEETEWTGTATGTGLPQLQPAAPWVTHLGLQPELLEASWEGAASWEAALRLPVRSAGNPPGQASLDLGLSLDEAAVQLPSHGLVLSGLGARAGFSFGAGGYEVLAEGGRAIWSEAPLRFGGRFAGRDAGGLAGNLSLSIADARLASEQSARALKLLGAEAWSAQKRLEGRFSANLDVPLADPLLGNARIDLQPLVLVTLPPRQAARREAARFEVQGRILFSGGQVQAEDLALTGPDVELALRDCSGSASRDGLLLSGRVVSARGMQLRPPLGLVAPQSVLDALDQIGVDGRIAPRDLRFTLDWQAGANPQVKAEGSLELSEFRLDGPPPVENGAGLLACESFSWLGPGEFSGRFRLDEGTATVAGVGVTRALAEVQLNQDRVVVTGFAAEALGGRIATDWIDETGASRHGAFLLGLAGRAEVRGEFRFDHFLLERLGEELGFRGPLAGSLSGEIDLRGPDPSPVNYQGSVHLDIQDGVLGTVPVLAQIWRLVGVDSPTFREGELRMKMLGDGLILVETMSLTHPLLEVTGEHLITMDSYLRLKVTVRTLGFVGRLPLIRDVLDWIVEQDVYGPAAAPQLRQRGLGKIFTGDTVRVPFPLWVPPVPRPDWRRSPALPAEPLAEPAAAPRP